MNKQVVRKIRNSLSAAIAVGLGIAATSSTALAVELDNNDRLGDAGIFQYYTVNGGWQTFIRVVNTSENAVSVKVRFREAANSREVLDFIVFLSPNDVWAGWTDVDATGNGKPGVRTMDTSCLYPLQDSNNTDEGWKTLNPDTGLLGADFQDRAFTGDYDDYAYASDADRLAEGYIEVIGIGQYDPDWAFGRAVTHDHFTGKPQSCTEASDLFEDNSWETGSYGYEVDNVLAMNGYVINVALGQGGGFDPDILKDFWTCRPGFLSECDFRTPPSLQTQALRTDTNPDLDSAFNPRLYDNGLNVDRPKQKGKLGLMPVSGGVDDVSFQIMRASVINEWAASANPLAVVSDYYTQWVMTFPTKHYYVDLDYDNDFSDDVSPTLYGWGPYAYRPFMESFPYHGESCEPYEMSIFNREEESYEFTSPAPIYPVELCNEVNTLVFNQFYTDKGLDSNFAVTFPTELLPVDSGGATSERGWAEMGFLGEKGRFLEQGEEGEHVRYGLPVTGWMLSVFNTNDNATNHTTINSHKYRIAEVYRDQPD